MSGKLQREIEEILSRSDKAAPRRRRWRNRFRRWRQPLWQARGQVQLRRPALSQVMLLGILLLVVAFFFRSTLPYTAYAGLALFFGAFALSFRRSRVGPDLRWRGRSLDLYQPSVGGRIRRRWRLWRGRRGRP